MGSQLDCAAGTLRHEVNRSHIIELRQQVGNLLDAVLVRIQRDDNQFAIGSRLSQQVGKQILIAIQRGIDDHHFADGVQRLVRVRFPGNDGAD